MNLYLRLHLVKRTLSRPTMNNMEDLTILVDEHNIFHWTKPTNWCTSDGSVS